MAPCHPIAVEPSHPGHARVQMSHVRISSLYRSYDLIMSGICMANAALEPPLSQPLPSSRAPGSSGAAEIRLMNG